MANTAGKGSVVQLHNDMLVDPLRLEYNVAMDVDSGRKAYSVDTEKHIGYYLEMANLWGQSKSYKKVVHKTCFFKIRKFRKKGIFS